MNRIILLLSAHMPHLVFAALAAIVVAGAVALLERRNARERAYRACYLFVGCIASVVAGSWLMYLVHG